MKLILALLMTVMAFNAFAADQNYINAAGTVVTQAKEFGVFVNGASAALTVGEGVCFDLTDDDAIHIDYCVDGYPPVGVITDTSCAVGARCKVQTKGIFQAAVLSPAYGAAVAGNSAFVYTDGAMYGDTTDDNKAPIGVFLDASTTTGTIQLYINP